jgi:hypothetical protein
MPLPTTEPELSPDLKQAEETAQAHNFVLLCGLHRSGTTLLFRMLREHPAMSGFTNNKVPTEWLALEDEGQFLQSVYPPGIVYGGPGSFAFSPDAHVTETSELLTRENRAQLAADWFPYWDLSRKFLLEKSPPNILMTRFLQSALPNSSFVAIIRHPVAVSLATTKWSHRSLDQLLEHWMVAHEVYTSDVPHLKHSMAVKYEALIADPPGELRKIYQFLGVEPHPTTFQATTEHNQRYFAQWQDMLKSPESGPAVREWIARLEPRARAFGYSLEDLNLY